MNTEPAAVVVAAAVDTDFGSGVPVQQMQPYRQCPKYPSSQPLHLQQVAAAAAIRAAVEADIRSRPVAVVVEYTAAA